MPSELYLKELDLIKKMERRRDEQMRRRLDEQIGGRKADALAEAGPLFSQRFEGWKESSPENREWAEQALNDWVHDPEFDPANTRDVLGEQLGKQAQKARYAHERDRPDSPRYSYRTNISSNPHTVAELTGLDPLGIPSADNGSYEAYEPVELTSAEIARKYAEARLPDDIVDEPTASALRVESPEDGPPPVPVEEEKVAQPVPTPPEFMGTHLNPEAAHFAYIDMGGPAGMDEGVTMIGRPDALDSKFLEEEFDVGRAQRFIESEHPVMPNYPEFNDPVRLVDGRTAKDYLTGLKNRKDAHLKEAEMGPMLDEEATVLSAQAFASEYPSEFEPTGQSYVQGQAPHPFPEMPYRDAMVNPEMAPELLGYGASTANAQAAADASVAKQGIVTAGRVAESQAASQEKARAEALKKYELDQDEVNKKRDQINTILDDLRSTLAKDFSGGYEDMDPDTYDKLLTELEQTGKGQQAKTLRALRDEIESAQGRISEYRGEGGAGRATRSEGIVAMARQMGGA